LRSWDRLAVPRPYQPATCITAEPIYVPANLGREELESYRQKLEQTLHTLTERAERAAETGRRPAALVPATEQQTRAKAA
jgi:hypothetical protein